jgi:uncharacterized membrane protein YjgN (DUF898 family)
MAGETSPLGEDNGHLEMENQQAIDDFRRPYDARNPEFKIYQVLQRLRWPRLTNLLVIIFSLGLLFPWARVRRARYLVGSLTLHSDRSLDTFAAVEQSAESAIGEAATGFFDIDIGL